MALPVVPWVVGAATSGLLHLAGKKKLNVRLFRPLPNLLISETRFPPVDAACALAKGFSAVSSMQRWGSS